MSFFRAVRRIVHQDVNINSAAATVDVTLSTTLTNYLMAVKTAILSSQSTGWSNCDIISNTTMRFTKAPGVGTMVVDGTVDIIEYR